MRNVPLLATGMMVCVSLMYSVVGAARERPWCVGYAEADITPAPGQVQMSGFPDYPGAMRDCLAGTLSDTNAVFVQEGGNEGLIAQHASSLPAPFTENIDSEVSRIVTEAIDVVK